MDKNQMLACGGRENPRGNFFTTPQARKIRAGRQKCEREKKKITDAH